MQQRWVMRELVDASAAIAGAGAVWAVPDGWYDALVVEDGILEWAQVGALLVVLVTCAVRAWAGRRRRGRTWPLWAAAAVVVAAAVGEEMAWGSRLFSVAVPSVQEGNVQGDLTLHNLGGLRGLSRTFGALSLLGLAGAGVALWTRRLGLALWFGMPALYCAFRVLDNDPITSRFAKLSEVLEFVLYVALVRLVVLRSQRRATTATSDVGHQLVHLH